VTVTASPEAGSLTVVSASPAQDEVLLARIQAGDDRALGIAYDQHVDLIFGVARRVTRDEQLARDITQEVFAYLWELPGRVDLSRGSLRSYLSVIAHRRAVDEVRRSERRTRTEASAASEPVEEGPEAEVVEAATQTWRRSRLLAGMAQLPPEQRVALELAYYDGLTYKQVAQALGVPEGTVKSRLRGAMSRLRTLLGEQMRTAI